VSERDDGRVADRNDPAVIRRLMTTPATWAVVGLSNNPVRPAYEVSEFLVERLRMTIIPIHRRADTVHGAAGFVSLAEIPDGTQVDVVDCFVNSQRVGEVVDQAIAERDRLGIGAVWLQLGVVDEAAARRAAEAGLDVVMDTCPKIEFRHL